MMNEFVQERLTELIDNFSFRYIFIVYENECK